MSLSLFRLLLYGFHKLSFGFSHTCLCGSHISVIELELLARFRVEGKSGVPDTNKINKGLNKIKPKLTAKEGSDGKIKPGLSI